MEYSFLFGCVKSLFCASAFSAAMPRRLSLTLKYFKKYDNFLAFLYIKTGRTEQFPKSVMALNKLFIQSGP